MEIWKLEIPELWKTLEEINKIRNFRLAIGYVGWLDIPEGSNQVKWSLFPHSVSPRGETATVDRFAVLKTLNYLSRAFPLLVTFLRI